MHQRLKIVHPFSGSLGMQKIEHIGIAVKTLTQSIPLFERLLNRSCYKIENVESEGVKTAFFELGNDKLELLESADPDGVIARYIAKYGEGVHHIALAVTDIEAEMERLAAAGFQLLQDRPRRGADNKMVCFLHPKSANGILIELCMERVDG
ncbi:MAG: methylmalonyl-CoA epimerase [Puia sp.]